MPGDEGRSRSPDVAQGGRVIAVLDMDRGAPADQAMFYVELTRARDNVVLLTDDREALIEALEASPAEEVSALRAIGEQFEVSTSASAPAETITQSPSPRKPAVLDETTRERRNSIAHHAHILETRPGSAGSRPGAPDTDTVLGNLACPHGLRTIRLMSVVHPSCTCRLCRNVTCQSTDKRP